MQHFAKLKPTIISVLVQNKFKVCLRAGSTDKYRDFTITHLLLVELLSIEDGTGACSWVFRTPKFPFDGLLSAPGLWVKYTSVTSSMINVVRNYNTMSQNLEKSVKFEKKRKILIFFGEREITIL